VSIVAHAELAHQIQRLSIRVALAAHRTLFNAAAMQGSMVPHSRQRNVQRVRPVHYTQQLYRVVSMVAKTILFYVFAMQDTMEMAVRALSADRVG
jgi:hypothetical protein